MKFRKRPVVIEAFQFTREVALLSLTNEQPLPFGLSASGNWNVSGGRRYLLWATIGIETLEGVMRADLDDWIIKGVKGELYPIKDEIFRETYEAVE